jgi:hypothetical protein
MTATQGEAPPPNDSQPDDLQTDEPASKSPATEETSETTGDKPAPTKPKGARKGAPKPKPKPIARAIAVLVLIGIPVALLLFSGRDRGARVPASTRWNAGQEVDVDITLVETDRASLACASADDVGGKHCAFESSTKPWSKGDNNDDKKLLRPYYTVGHDPFIAAGVWSEPALRGQLPKERFAVKCKYKVEGKIKKPSVRWKAEGPWYDETIEWPVGTVSGCTLAK